MRSAPGRELLGDDHHETSRPKSSLSWLRVLGWALSLGACFFVVRALVRHATAFREAGLALVDLPPLLSILGYVLVTVACAASWKVLTGLYGRPLSLASAYAVWGQSQLAKYLPGNVFHIVVRQTLGARAGLRQAAAAAATVTEHASLVLVAILVIALRAATSSLELPPLATWAGLLAVGLAALGAWPVLETLLRSFERTRPLFAGLPRPSLGRSLAVMLPAAALHALFFAATGLILVALVAFVSEATATDHALRIVAAFALAWLLGTIVPGAPGGLGVREAVLTHQLAPILDPGAAAIVAIALRFVTVGGDVVTGVVAAWVGRRGEVGTG